MGFAILCFVFLHSGLGVGVVGVIRGASMGWSSFGVFAQWLGVGGGEGVGGRSMMCFRAFSRQFRVCMGGW